MKKNYLLLCLIPLFFSCEKDESLNSLENPTPVLTRSSVEVPELLDQLGGIPVNFILRRPGNSKYIYLSTAKKNATIDLFDKDDGSLRQRWYIEKHKNYIGDCYRLKVVGNAYYDRGYLGISGSFKESVPKLHKPDVNYSIVDINIRPAFNPDYYSITSFSFATLQAKSFTSKDLEFIPPASLSNPVGNLNSDLHSWEIVPVNNFQLVDIKYVQEPNDKVELNLALVRDYNIPNKNGPTPVTKSVTVDEEISESSSFGKTVGINMSLKVSSSTKVGLPVVNGDMTVSTDQTTSYQWLYTVEETESKKTSVKDVFSVTVPAYTDMMVRFRVYTYDLNITYIATFREIGGSGKTIQLKGKWKGTSGYKIDYEPYVKENGQLIPAKGNCIESEAENRDYY